MYFDETKGWTLEDGLEGKGSTNGTWMYVAEEQEMYDGLLFKTQQTLFSVSPDTHKSS